MNAPFTAMYGYFGGMFVGYTLIADDDSTGGDEWIVPVLLGAVGATVALILGAPPAYYDCLRFDSLTTTEQDSVLQDLVEVHGSD